MKPTHKTQLGSVSFGALTFALFATAGVGAANAQDSGSASDIVVTAQKREQRLQDVPVVVTALSETALQNAGVKDIKDLQTLTPGLTVTSTTSETSTTARIRGIGTVGDNPGLESSVGIVIDGIYRPRNGVSFGDIGDLERVEILKGPQGTLFGKNTSAGVINVITQAPTFKQSTTIEATAGNYGQAGGSVSINGPIIDDKLAARLYVASRSREGFYDVVTAEGPRTNTEDMDQDFFTTRAQLLFVPTDKLDFRFIFDYTKRDENCCVAVQTRTGPTGAIANAFATGGQGVANPANPFNRVAYANRDTTQKVKDRGVSLEGNLQIESWNATLTSITGLRAWDSTTGLDADFTGADIWYRPADGSNTVGFDQFSEEIRLAGATDKFDWMVGAFYAKEDLKRKDSLVFGADYETFFSTALANNLDGLAARSTGGLVRVNTSGTNAVTFVNATNPATAVTGASFIPGQGYRDTYSQSSETLALFTNDTWHVTDKFDLTLGLRYSSEDKDATSQFGGDLVTGCASALTPAGQQAIAAALIARGVPAAAFSTTPNSLSALGVGLIQTTVGGLCLPRWNPQFNGQTRTQSNSEEEWSGTIKAAYRFTPDFMAYASYARGYKAGGFNLDRTASSNGLQSGNAGVIPVFNTGFPAEFVDSYEIGAKTSWLDGQLVINATAFLQEFSDFQLNTFVGTEFVVDALPEVTTTGIDADFIWFVPNSGLSFQGGVTYADTQIENFTASDLVSPARFSALSLLPGQTLGFAPEWSGSASVTYERAVTDQLRMLASLSAKYQSEYNTGSDLAPFKAQDAFTVLNGRIGIGAEDERWALELWGNNLADEDYYQVVFAAPLQGQLIPTGVSTYSVANDSNTYAGFLGAPRTWGATLRLKF